MALIEILEIAMPDAGGRLRGAAIDAPRAGDASDLWSIGLSGWVLGGTAAVEAVEFVCEDIVLQTTCIGLPRPDVALALQTSEAQQTGFSGVLGLLGLPAEFEIEVRACLVGGDRCTFAVLRGRHGPARSTFRPRLQPLMVTSILGRIGRTWLMHLLAQHPQIVADRVYPYENLSASYWLHLLKVLTGPANHRDWSRAITFHGQDGMIGTHPLNIPSIAPESPPIERGPAEWLGGPYVVEVASFCQASIEGYYQTMARAQGRGEPRYFVEKFSPSHLPRLAWDLYPQAREVFLVRDFRDVVCSVLAFNAKRGFASFYRELAATDAEYVRGLRVETQRFYNCWLERRDRSLLVRYEDVVLDPAEWLRRILTYLDLDADPETINRMLASAGPTMPELEAHRTSRSPVESIGRWRRDLSTELQQAGEEAFGDVLRGFGYDSRSGESLGLIPAGGDETVEHHWAVNEQHTASRPPPASASPSVDTLEGVNGQRPKQTGYPQVRRRIRELVNAELPTDSVVVVVSRGDDNLLQLGPRWGWHFPQTENGVYAGCHPADSREAIAHLEEIRRKGGDYLLFPSTAFWWLGFYGDFQKHLESHYPCVWSDPSCLIFQLSTTPAGRDRRG